MVHICEACGKEFESVCSTVKYCSKKCREKCFADKHGGRSAYRKKIYKKKVHEPRRCDCCNNLFVPTRADAKYCSASCKHHVEKIRSRVKRNNMNIHLVDCKGRISSKCSCCGGPFIPEKGETMCKSCQAFLKFTNAHPEIL